MTDTANREKAGAPVDAARRSLATIPFDPSEVKVVEGMARWAGLLGRFQVLAGGFLILLVLGAAAVFGLAGALDRGTPVATDTTPPVVTLGEVAPETLTWVALGCLALGALVLRGGIFLTDAAEDFEHAAHGSVAGQEHLVSGSRRLTGYFDMHTLLAGLALGAVVAAVWGVG